MLLLIVIMLCSIMLCGCNVESSDITVNTSMVVNETETTKVVSTPLPVSTSEPISVIELLVNGNQGLPVDMYQLLNNGWYIHLLNDLPVEPGRTINSVLLLCPNYPDARVIASVNNPYEMTFPLNMCEVTTLSLESDSASIEYAFTGNVQWEEVPQPEEELLPSFNWVNQTNFLLGGETYSFPIEVEELLHNGWECCDGVYMLPNTDYYLKLLNEDGSGFHIIESNVCTEFSYGLLSCNSSIEEIYRIFGNQWDKHFIISNRHYITYSKDDMSLTVVIAGGGIAEVVLSNDTPTWDYVKYNLYQLYN